jgi:hypothetical protein
MEAQGSSGLLTLAVPTGSLDCDGCATCVEERLRENPHVVNAHVDARREVVHVTVHEGMVTTDELAETIAAACGDRNPVPLPKPPVSAHAHAHITHPPDVKGAAGHDSHMGSRMPQVDTHAAHGMEAPASAAEQHLGHGPASVAEHAGMDHAAMDHAAMRHAGHGSHDMSDPRMAAAM